MPLILILLFLLQCIYYTNTTPTWPTPSVPDTRYTLLHYMIVSQTTRMLMYGLSDYHLDLSSKVYHGLFIFFYKSMDNMVRST